jgi:hypothetical protein
VTLPEPRYVVTEIEGYVVGGNGSGRPGLSCMVIDRHVNYRLLGTYRTEDHEGGRGYTHERIRAETRLQAHRHASRLNG